jgi:hypothetical protein
MLWSEEEQQYCKYTEGPGNGNVSGEYTQIIVVVM